MEKFPELDDLPVQDDKAAPDLFSGGVLGDGNNPIAGIICFESMDG